MSPITTDTFDLIVNCTANGSFDDPGTYCFDVTVSESTVAYSDSSNKEQLGSLGADDECFTIPDGDGDGVPDNLDNCPGTSNPGQEDNYGNSAGDACEDTDLDLILDDIDSCPEDFGLPEFNGCPPEGDNDSDGVLNNVDDCPNVFGLLELNGCTPEGDNDGDGVLNNVDACPNDFGESNLNPELNGCPPDGGGDAVFALKLSATRQVAYPQGDNDGDRVLNNEDLCPDAFGLPELNGCSPDGDNDGDKVLNNEDLCPDEFGLAALNGCPPEG